MVRSILTLWRGGAVLVLLGCSALAIASLGSAPARKSEAGPVPTQAPGGETTLARVKRTGRLVVGLQENYEPFHVRNANSGYPGIDVELAQLLGSTLGARVELRFLDLPQLLDAVGKNEVDVSFGGISSSLGRAAAVNFSLPYVVTTPAGLLARAVLPPESESVDFPRRDFKSLADLKYLGRLTIGVRAGTTNEAILRQYPEFSKHSIETFPDRVAVLDALKKRTVDVLVADGVHVNSLVQKDSALLSAFLPLTGRFSEEHICAALPKGDPEFWNYLNFFVREIRRSGQLHGILKKYFEGSEWIKKD